MAKTLFKEGSYVLTREGVFYRLLRNGDPIYTGKDYDLAYRWFWRFVDMEGSGK